MRFHFTSSWASCRVDDPSAEKARKTNQEKIAGAGDKSPRGRFGFKVEMLEFSFRSSVLGKALRAVYGSALSGFKWNLGLFPAVRTSDIVHHSRRSGVVAAISLAISRSVSIVSPISITHFLKSLQLTFH
jgi:hypothetical protein